MWFLQPGGSGWQLCRFAGLLPQPMVHAQHTGGTVLWSDRVEAGSGVQGFGGRCVLPMVCLGVRSADLAWLQASRLPVVAVGQPPEVSIMSPLGLMRTIFVLWKRSTTSSTPARQSPVCAGAGAGQHTKSLADSSCQTQEGTASHPSQPT